MAKLPVLFEVCIAPDYSKPSLVKAYHEAMRSFDILMKFYPEKVVAGLIIFFFFFSTQNFIIIPL
jgi:hypothetical protein